MKRELQLFLLSFFPRRYKDPWQTAMRAYRHLADDFYTRASFLDRGWALPNQLEALDILDTARRSIGSRSPLLRAEPSAEAGKLR